jgi:hypothetical protein
MQQQHLSKRDQAVVSSMMHGGFQASVHEADIDELDDDGDGVI